MLNRLVNNQTDIKYSKKVESGYTVALEIRPAILVELH